MSSDRDRDRDGDVVRFDEVTSTQDVARDLVAAGRGKHGTCVVARVQTAGRGRRGRAWLSADGALAVSLIVEPACALVDAPKLTLAAGAGLLRACDAVGVDAFVKWPNDVVIGGAPATGKLGPFRKVAGVIVEVAETRGDRLTRCILGAGVNVRAPAGGWPDDIADTAGALADAGFTGDADDVLQAFRVHVPRALDDALADFDATLAALARRSATLGRRVEVDGVTGVARGFAADGALLVVDDGGVEHVVRAGDVWFATEHLA